MKILNCVGGVLEKAGKIKVVQIIADSSIGGGPNHVLGILRNIDKEAFDCYLICPPGYLSVEGRLIDSVKVFNVPMISKFDIYSILKLRSKIQEIQAEHDPFGPMIVHSHGTRAGFMARLVSSNSSKSAYTEHRYDEDYHIKNKLNEWLQKKILGFLNKKTDLVIAVSGSVKSFLLKNNLAPEDRIVLIPNGIDLKLSTDDRQPTTKNLAHPVIGNIGNLNIQKGQEYLIEAMAEVKKSFPLVTLEIIGEGELRSKLENKIKELGLLHHVTLLGRKKDVRKYLKHWRVFVLPSVAETFGIAVLEAMQEGIPVVATRVGGIPDIVTNNKNGLLVPSRNPKELAGSIVEILKSHALSAKLRREGKERAKDFEWRDIVKTIQKEYKNLAGG